MNYVHMGFWLQVEKKCKAKSIEEMELFKYFPIFIMC